MRHEIKLVVAGCVVIAMLVLGLAGHRPARVALAAGPASPTTVPVLTQPLLYQLHVGQHLVYDSGPVSDASVLRTHADAWVLSDTADGGWRVAVQQTLRRLRPSYAWADLCVFKLRRDGVATAEVRGDYVDSAAYFPPLPSSSDGPNGRAFTDDWGDAARVRLCTDPNPRMVQMVTDHDRPYDRLFPQDRSTIVRFDLTAGSVVQRSATSTTAAVTFAAKPDLSPTQLRDVTDDAMLTARTRKGCEAADHTWDGRGKLPSLGLINTVMAAMRTDSFSQFWSVYMSSQIIGSCQQREYGVRRAEMIGRPASDFKAMDLAGTEHRLQNYRGRTVILDFWARRCPPCMLLTPRLARQLAARRDVVLLNMSLDLRPEPTEQVVQAIGLTSPVLRATAVGESLKVNIWPTVFVIDPQGIVRDVFVGLSGDTDQDILQTVANPLEPYAVK